MLNKLMRLLDKYIGGTFFVVTIMKWYWRGTIYSLRYSNRGPGNFQTGFSDCCCLQLVEIDAKDGEVFFARMIADSTKK